MTLDGRTCAGGGLVPRDFQMIGYSGLFRAESNWAGTPEELVTFEAGLPKLPPTPGWMALAVNREAEPPTVVLVRRDSDAVVEALTARPARDDAVAWLAGEEGS